MTGRATASAWALVRVMAKAPAYRESILRASINDIQRAGSHVPIEPTIRGCRALLPLPVLLERLRHERLDRAAKLGGQLAQDAARIRRNVLVRPRLEHVMVEQHAPG